MSGLEDRAGTEPVPSLAARLFVEAPVGVRRKVVACLLGAAGPLALAVLADGRFARFLLPSADAMAVTLEEARRLSEGQVLSLARYAWEASPEVFSQLAQLLQLESPSLLQTATGALFLLAMGLAGRRRKPARDPDPTP